MSYLSVPAQRVLSRLTAAEMKTVLLAQGLLTGSGDDPPSYLSGEAALSWYDWNEGAGEYYATSPSYRYRGNRYVAAEDGSNRRGRDIYAALEAAFVASPTTFLSVFSVVRIAELTDAAHPQAATGRAVSNLAIWNQTQYSGVTAPSALEITLPVEMWYNAGTPRYTASQAVTQLAAQPVGQRCLKMGGFGALGGNFTAFWSIPTNSADTNNAWRECVFDRDFDTFHRRGLLMDTWQEAMLDGSSTWRTWWEDLRSIGGAAIVDQLMLDFGEGNYPRFWKLGSSAGPSPAVAVTTAVSIDDGTDVLTDTAHGMETGQPIKFRGESPVSNPSGTLPSVGGVKVSASTVYYVRRIDADTFTLHLTPAGAVANTGKVDFSAAGTSVKYDPYSETLANWFLDDDWETVRTTILTPALAQGVWDGYDSWDIHNDERAFLFDAAYEAYFAAKVAPVLQIVIDEFPDIMIADYNLGHRCPATRSTLSAPALGQFPYSSGVRIGTASSHFAYMIYDTKTYKWSTPGTTTQTFSGDDAGKAWATLLQGIATTRSLAGSDSSLQIWMCPTQGGIDITEDSDLAKEYILHLVLPSVARLGFYNSSAFSDLPTVAQQTLALNLVAERDKVVLYDPAILDPQDDIAADYTSKYATTRVWSGGRWVWRVTPKPGVTVKKYQTASGVRFTFDSTVTLNISGGYLHEPGDTYATAGYWVVQPLGPQATQGQFGRSSTSENVYVRT